jgi:hypothetical protein
MMSLIAIISVALVAAGLAIVAISLARAPLGYEDEDGFHEGREREPERHDT